MNQVGASSASVLSAKRSSLRNVWKSFQIPPSVRPAKRKPRKGRLARPNTAPAAAPPCKSASAAAEESPPMNSPAQAVEGVDDYQLGLSLHYSVLHYTVVLHSSRLFALASFFHRKSFRHA